MNNNAVIYVLFHMPFFRDNSFLLIFSSQGHPEDLTFFYQHLRNNGSLHRVNETLLTYRYHEIAASFSVHENTIWDARLEFLEERVLPRLDRFTIWNAGKQGRRFYRSLNSSDRRKVLFLLLYQCSQIMPVGYLSDLAIGHFLFSQRS